MIQNASDSADTESARHGQNQEKEKKTPTNEWNIFLSIFFPTENNKLHFWIQYFPFENSHSESWIEMSFSWAFQTEAYFTTKLRSI